MSHLDGQGYLERLHELWRTHWPADVPLELSYPHGQVLTDYLRARARQVPDRAVIVYYGYELTFAELDDASDRFAGHLEREGLGPGSRVAVFMSNCPQFLIAFYGILKAGCVHVPVNPMFKEAELAFELEDTEPGLVVTFEELLPLLERVRDPEVTTGVVVTTSAEYLPAEPTLPVPSGVDQAPRAPTPATGVGGWTAFADAIAGDPPTDPVPGDPDRLAALNYTGGTTGMPKGCEHTQRDMVYTSACTSLGSDDDQPDVSLVFIPVFWIAGENSVVIAPVFTGTTCVLLNRWDPDAVLAAIERYGVTRMSATVDNYLELMDHPRFDETDLSSLRTSAAMSFVKKLTPEIRELWRRRAGDHLALREASYGMTETHTMDTLTYGFQDDDLDLHSQPVFVGVPYPGTEIKIADFETGELVPLGDNGEIVIRTPSLLKGYWRRPDATADAIRDGWLHTGDVGTLDEEGFLHFLGRRKEMLKVNGMSVFPTEIEVLLNQHPDVDSCSVVGMPDPRTGEIPVACVIPADGGAELTEESLVAWCKENMATYKVPRIRILEEFPMTTTGKVKKEELKQSLAD